MLARTAALTASLLLVFSSGCGKSDNPRPEVAGAATPATPAAPAAPAALAAPSTGLKDIDPGVTVSTEDAAAIWKVMDDYMTYFRAPLAENIDRDLETMHFPHVRVADHQVVVFPDAKSYKDMSLNHLDEFMQGGWDHSEWGTRRIVQADTEKAHVAVTFNRYRKDQTLIATEESFYILEKIDGRWGVRGRSSFAK